MGNEAELPEVIVRPENADQVSKILIVANENLSPVTPAAGGLSGGFALPAIQPGGIYRNTTGSGYFRILCRWNLLIDDPSVVEGN